MDRGAGTRANGVGVVMGLQSLPLTCGRVPVILWDVDTAKQLRELFKAGWALQVAPELSPLGVVYASVVWSLKRAARDATLDGAVASLPLLHRVNLADPDGFVGEVATMYARVFPIAVDGAQAAQGDSGVIAGGEAPEESADDLPEDSPFREL